MIRRPTSRPPRRPGFTLIELLVVITIIGILVALLLPAIIAAVRRANEARVSADIQTLAVALTTFRNTYGEYPPSRVILSETGVYSHAYGSLAPTGAMISPTAADYSTSLSSITFIGGPPNGAVYAADADISFGLLAERSLRAIRKYFPRAVPPTAALFHDFNGNNSMDSGFIYLQGDECLAFFLGGIPNPDLTANGGFAMSGFGRNPLYPFQNSTITTNRSQSLFEFRADRLIDQDGDGIPSYVDPNGSSSTFTPYAYFVSYGAAGYDANDCNFDGSSGCPFQIGMPVTNGNGYTTSPSPNPYTSSLPVQLTVSQTFNPLQPTSYLNPNSFQLISSGGDQTFGPGGQFVNSGNEKVLAPPSPPYSISQDDRAVERDNLTNFTQGRLE